MRLRHRYSPADDPNLVALARGLEPQFPSLSHHQRMALAQGYVQLLRRWCWRECSDLIANPDALEAAAGWDGPPRTLYKALRDADYVDEWNGCVLIMSAVMEAPAYARTRWQRKGEAYKAAQARQHRPEVSPAEDVAALERKIESGLFGDLQPHEIREQPKAHGPDPRIREFTEHWNTAWTTRYQTRYPWSARDFAVIKQLLAAVKDVQALKTASDAYLAAKDGYLMGHPLTKLFTNLSRFVAGSRKTQVASAVSADIDRRMAETRLRWLREFSEARPTEFVEVISTARCRLMETKGAGAAEKFDNLLDQTMTGAAFSIEAGRMAAWLMGIQQEKRSHEQV